MKIKTLSLILILMETLVKDFWNFTAKQYCPSDAVICFPFHKISLQSEAGQYECSVSALRWVCKEKVSFTYQFRSWEEHLKRPLCKDYMQAGPLMDISVTSGNIEELHLPHWISIGE